MEKIRLEILTITHGVSHSHSYAVVLTEVHGSRRLPIVIGGFEAQGIAIALEKMTPNRPLTHDLFKATLERFNIDVKEVIINDLIDGIFYAQLICEEGGNVSIIDSRTSDALAMAVRFNCPIFTYSHIMDQAGVEMEVDGNYGNIQAKPKDNNPAMQSIDDLENQLAEAIEQEDYEKAAKIRDELTKRRGN